MADGATAARVGRLTAATDFERVLRLRSRAQGPHFALHHLAGVPARRVPPAPTSELSTDGIQDGARPVDDSSGEGLHLAPASSPVPASPLWLGAVVPKRHARRAVTRNLMKRQIRSLVQARAATLPPGLWVVRLRAGFDRTLFPSASSSPLRQAVREELDGLLRRCAGDKVAWSPGTDRSRSRPS